MTTEQLVAGGLQSGRGPAKSASSERGSRIAAAGRAVELDKLRGLAVVLMLADHLLIVGGAPTWTRENLTRAAFPLFLLLAGHLARRCSWRLGVLLLAGYVLDELVPWAYGGRVLSILAVTIAVVVLLRRWPAALLAVVLLALTLYLNGRLYGVGYDSGAALALGCLGALLRRDQLVAAGRRLPAALAVAGRFPLSVYVGHLLALQLVVSL